MIANLMNKAVQWVFDWNAYRRRRWEERRRLASTRASDRWWREDYGKTPLSREISADQERRAEKRRKELGAAAEIFDALRSGDAEPVEAES